MEQMNTRTAFIAIVGCPNVGKSSLLNCMLGQKVAIVSNKPQTTRTKIMGVLTQGEVQYVFTDTPGLHKPKNKLGEQMVQAVKDGISGGDVCLMVVEPTGELRDAEKELIERFKKDKLPVVLAINKIDKLSQKELLMERIAQLMQEYPFTAVVPVSALSGDGVQALLEELSKLTVASPHFFEDDTLTDQPERVLAAEMIREKLLMLLDKEIPHGIAVSIEKMREREDKPITDVEAVIYCEKESHKGIVIGKGGSMLKKASSLARADMEAFFDCKINLQCWVKVKEDWRSRNSIIHNFGLDARD